MKKYQIGDIVFVSNYEYKNQEAGTNHCFVIIDDGKAIDIDYFGFLISSNLSKQSYPYNEVLLKNHRNHLYKDSIVKCDDLIQVEESEIQFKIGTVEKEDVERFIQKYSEYLETI